MNEKKPDLQTAYALKTPEDSVRLYREWAETYDQSFAERMDYVIPEVLAREFAAMAQAGDAPVLDVGAGTGLVGEALARLGDWPVEGLDISAEMLEVAMAKGVYDAAHLGDLTGRLPLEDGRFGAVLSSGTFTHGHVGPDALDELLRVARKGALFMLGVNGEFFVKSGFAAKLESLAPRIDGLTKLIRRGYGDKAPPERRQDRTTIVVFRKA